MRIADMEELIAAYKREGIDPEPYYWFTDQRKYGTCEHGGYGLGVEVRTSTNPFSTLNGLDEQRFLAWLADRYTVRECSLYPRYNLVSPCSRVFLNILPGGRDARHLEPWISNGVLGDLLDGFRFIPIHICIRFLQRLSTFVDQLQIPRRTLLQDNEVFYRR